ncbi:MAG: hypothetical protein RLZZ468_909 [Cyanobacteriota bacterium]
MQAHSPEQGQDQLVAVRVVPRGSRNQVLGLRDGAVAIKLQAPPVEGAANAALLAYVAELVGLPRRAIHLVRGETSRSKWIAADGLGAAELRARLLAAAR